MTKSTSKEGKHVATDPFGVATDLCGCVKYAFANGPGVGRFAARAAVKQMRPTVFFTKCGPELHQYIKEFCR